MGGGSSTSSAPWAGAQPYLGQLYAGAFKTYNQDRPDPYRATYGYTDPTTGKVYSQSEYDALTKAWSAGQPQSSPSQAWGFGQSRPGGITTKSSPTSVPTSKYWNSAPPGASNPAYGGQAPGGGPAGGGYSQGSGSRPGGGWRPQPSAPATGPDPSTLTRGRILNTDALAGSNQALDEAMQRWQERSSSGSDLLRGAQSGIEATIRGDFMRPDSNPWLKSAYDQAAGDITNRVGHEMMLAGRGGSGAHQDLLQRGLGNLATDIYGGNYQRERENQMSAYGQAPMMSAADYADIDRQMQLGKQIQSGEQSAINADKAAWDLRENLPFQHLQQYANLLSGIPMPVNTNTQNKPGVLDIIGGLFG